MTKLGEYHIRVTPNAIANIKEIVDFYVATFPPAAEDFRDAVDAKLKLICENPYIYGIPDNLPNFAYLGYRKAPVYKHHVILYLIIDEDKKIVYIIYVVDTRRNLWLEIPMELPE